MMGGIPVVLGESGNQFDDGMSSHSFEWVGEILP